ncbi:hypothetical protein [Bradyrhizobium sp. NP1]|jgi:hypothetical protein|uniref:hypothetical protein n=1 Tax=Bradyrhizobium sp. NP1 TaxID=3049772 RepID=UPI0025A6824E|nr:hypothetical protein [Bradyrhizobium sp. NP1]WJR76156.1 hypothetical protein QOU61_25785 [Bradyrhizobium sp. NP1]
MDETMSQDHAHAMGQDHLMGVCPHCGRKLARAPLPSAAGVVVMQCAVCDPFDPLKSDHVTGWLKGELGRARETAAPPK